MSSNYLATHRALTTESVATRIASTYLNEIETVKSTRLLFIVASMTRPIRTTIYFPHSILSRRDITPQRRVAIAERMSLCVKRACLSDIFANPSSGMQVTTEAGSTGHAG